MENVNISKSVKMIFSKLSGLARHAKNW